MQATVLVPRVKEMLFGSTWSKDFWSALWSVLVNTLRESLSHWRVSRSSLR